MLRWELRSHPLFIAYCALAAVCFFWGTTYLGIRIALESVPPTLLIGLRFSISGAIMLCYAMITGAKLPRGRELALTAFYGVIILGGGTGCLVFAEQLIPSGLAALFVTTSPFWMVGIESLIPGGARLHGPTILGMVVGFAGVLLLLIGGADGPVVDVATVRGFLLLQAGAAFWAFGSISQKRLASSASPAMCGAVQQFATGLCFLLLSALTGATHYGSWNIQGIGAVLYLVTFGSIVGYSSYVYAMAHLPVAVVTIYNYINPVVAVFLGWLVYRERFGLREMAAMVVVFIGVALVKRATSSNQPLRPAAEPGAKRTAQGR